MADNRVNDNDLMNEKQNDDDDETVTSLTWPLLAGVVT